MKIVEIHTDNKIATDFEKWAIRHRLTFLTKEWLNCFSPSQIKVCSIQNKNNEIIGGFEYFIFNKSFVNAAISVPFTPHIALYYHNPAQNKVSKQSFDKEVSDLLAVYFSELSVQILQINLPHFYKDVQPFIWKKFEVKPKYTYLLPLNLTREDLKQNLSPEKRKSLNKAAKDGLEIKLSIEFNSIYQLIKNRLNENKIHSNKQELKNIIQHFSSSPNAFTFVAYHQNLAIACTFCVIHQNTAYYLFGGILSEQKHHGASVACMFESIIHAKNSGLAYFDFEGSMNETIERYFREFGGDLTPYLCIEKINASTKVLLNIKKTFRL